MASTAVKFEQELQDMLRDGAKRRAAPGSRWSRMMSGEANDEEMMVVLVQYYFHTLGFTNALRHVYARCDIPDIRAEIAEGLYEEETGGITGTAAHIELYYRMAEAFGLSRQKFEKEAWMVPEMGAIVHWYHYAATSLGLIEALAVLNFAAEGQNVEIDGIKGSAGLTLEVIKDRFHKTGDALSFYEVHAYADVEHCAVGARNLAKLAETEYQRNRIRTAVRMTYDVWAGQSRLTEKYTLADCWKPVESAMFYL